MKARLRFGWLILVLACAANAFGQGSGGQGLRRLLPPGKDWALDVSLPNFDVAEEDFSTVDTSYWLAATTGVDDKAGQPRLILTIRLEPAKVSGSDAELRDLTARRLKKSDPIKPTGVKTFQYKQIPGIKYAMGSVTIADGSRSAYIPAPTMHYMDAFFVKDDVWITFSATSASPTKEVEVLFYTVLDSVKFTDTSKPSSSFDHYYRAKSLIHQKQHTQAAEHLTTALDLERKQRRLGDEQWRSLIVQLADLYALMGDRARAKGVLEYGVSVEPTAPRFHFALAKHYATLDDVDNTIASLEKAYLYRKTDTATVAWFDPMRHPTFAAFKNNEKFRKAVKAMKK